MTDAPRNVRPITPEQLARIMGELNAPHPDAGEYGGDLAYRIWTYGMSAVGIVGLLFWAVTK